MKVIGQIFVLIFFFVLYSIWDGYVLKTLWNWFAVPLGYPALTVASALGIAVLVRMLCSKSIPDDKKNSFEDQLAKLIVYGAVVPAVALLMGWAAYQFV